MTSIYRWSIIFSVLSFMITMSYGLGWSIAFTGLVTVASFLDGFFDE